MKEVRQKSLLSYPEIDANMAATGTEWHAYDYDIAGVVQNYDTAYAEYVTDKMFCMDVKQINAVYNNSGILGKDYYIGEPTTQCVANSEYKTSSLAAGKKWCYWLRSPISRSRSGVRVVCSDGDVYYNSAFNSFDGGVRPAFYLNLSSSSIKSGSGTEANPYTIDGGSGGSADYETAILSYKKIDGKYVINSIARNNTDTAVSTVLYSAVYSDDGRLKGCGTVSADIAANDDTGVDINIGSDVKSGDAVKTYMWSNEMKALSTSDMITIQ